jgi:hypothetical protein
LQNGNGKDAKSRSEKAKDKDDASLLAKDYQLNEALNLLKGLAILHRQKAG